MKSITVTMDDDTYRRVHVKATENNMSVSAVVKRLLADYAAAEESEFDRLARQEREARAEIRDFRASDRLPRDKLYER